MKMKAELSDWFSEAEALYKGCLEMTPDPAAGAVGSGSSPTNLQAWQIFTQQHPRQTPRRQLIPQSEPHPRLYHTKPQDQQQAAAFSHCRISSVSAGILRILNTIKTDF